MDQTQYVLGFAFDDDEYRVVLMLKARPAWQNGKYNGVGGHIEPGESPMNAMVREWKEEVAGVEVDQWILFTTLSGPAFKVWCFRASAERIHRVESLSDGESIRTFEVRQLPQNIIPNLSWMIPMASLRNQADWPFAIEERSAESPE